jgi:glutamate formiminotransferase / 5-formyltetrahydrofolate cyclo-ligase
MPNKPLLAVPNVSEGRDQASIAAIAEAFASAETVRLLDVHSDGDHHRSVYTLAAVQGELSRAVLAGARVAVERIDVGDGRDPADAGEHPHVGAVDVMPVVYLDASQRGAACAEALVVAYEIGEGLGVPVFLYGELARGVATGGSDWAGRKVGRGRVASRLRPTTVAPDGGRHARGGERASRGLQSGARAARERR